MIDVCHAQIRLPSKCFVHSREVHASGSTHDPHGVDAEGVPDRNAKRRQGDRVLGETARNGHAERLPRELG